MSARDNIPVAISKDKNYIPKENPDRKHVQVELAYEIDAMETFYEIKV